MRGNSLCGVLSEPEAQGPQASVTSREIQLEQSIFIRLDQPPFPCKAKLRPEAGGGVKRAGRSGVISGAS